MELEREMLDIELDGVWEMGDGEGERVRFMEEVRVGVAGMRVSKARCFVWSARLSSYKVLQKVEVRSSAVLRL